MASSRKLSISLSKAQAEFVDRLVDSGRYADASAVISDCLRALQAREAALEGWLRRDVMQVYKELRADPSKGMTVDEARDALERRVQQRI